MLVEAAGFAAVYMTGGGVSATYGLPDYGLLTSLTHPMECAPAGGGVRGATDTVWRVR